jgi:hypothetical protein
MTVLTQPPMSDLVAPTSSTDPAVDKVLSCLHDAIAGLE